MGLIKKSINNYSFLNKKNIIIFLALFFGIFVLLMLIAAFCDLQITKTLYKILGGKSGTYSLFWQTVAFLPQYFIPGFFLIIIGLGYKKNIYLHVLFSFLGFLCFALEIYSIFYFIVVTNPKDTVQYNSGLAYAFSIPIALITFFTIYLSCFKISEENLITLRKFAYVVITVIILETLFVTLLKCSFYRARYNKHLDAENNSWFQPWYSLKYSFHNANKTSDNSFPSGHMASIDGIYFLLFLPFVVKSMYKTRNVMVFSIVSISLNALCAIGRMAGGYHFLSDVTVSGTLGFSLFTLFTYLFMFNKKISTCIGNLSKKLYMNIILSLIVIVALFIIQQFA